MTETRPKQLPPSAQLIDMIFGFARSRAIAVAAQLKVADFLKNGPKTADEIAAPVSYTHLTLPTIYSV